MKTFNSLEKFYSPVSGERDLKKGYIIEGNKQGVSYPSPSLIDVNLDIIEIRVLIEKLKALNFILQKASKLLPNAQALEDLMNGFVFNENGILVIKPVGEGTITLPEGHVLVGDEDDLAEARPTIDFENLPDLGVATVAGLPSPAGKIWRGTSSGRPEESNAISVIEVDILAITTRFLTAKWILGSAPVENLWPNAQFINKLAENRILTHTTNGNIGVAGLTFKKIFRGNIFNVPVESDDLTAVENNLGSALSDLADLASTVSSIASTVNALSAAVGAIETGLVLVGGFIGLVALQGQVAGLIIATGQLASRVDSNDTDIGTLQTQVGDINTKITDITTSIFSIISQINNLKLNNIPANGDVSFYGYKGINFGDAVSLTDAVNLRVLNQKIAAAIATLPTSYPITLAGAISGSGQTGTTINTVFNLTLNQIANAGNINFSSYRLLNVATPTASTDGVNKTYVDTAIASVPVNPMITIGGDVSGSGPSNSTINTTLNLTLDQVKKAQSTVDLNNQSIKQLNCENIDGGSAINVQFLFDLFDKDVGVTWTQ